MATTITKGRVTGTISYTNGKNDRIVWWHNSSSPFAIIITFSEDCEEFTIRFLKTGKGMSSFTLDGVTYKFPSSCIVDGIAPSTGGAFGMGFYVAATVGNTDLESVNDKTLWGRADGKISMKGTTSQYQYNYAANYSSCVTYLPHSDAKLGTAVTKVNILSKYKNNYNYTYTHTFSANASDTGGTKKRITFDCKCTRKSSDFGIKGRAKKLIFYGCCESASPNASNVQCYSYEYTKGKFFGQIMNLNLNLKYPPVGLKISKREGSGTTLYTTITWTESSTAINYSDTDQTKYDTLHYALTTADSGGEVLFEDTVQGAGSVSLLFTELDVGTTYYLDYYITVNDGEDTTKYLKPSKPIAIRTYNIDTVNSKLVTAGLHGASFTLQYQKDSNMVDKVINYQVVNSSYNAIDGQGVNKCNSGNTCGASKGYSANVTGLESDTNYYLKVWLDNTNNSTGGSFNIGSPDTIIYIRFKTNKSFSFGNANLSATGTTITITQPISWAGSSFTREGTGVKARIENSNGNTIAESPIITTGNLNYKFTGLNRGEMYTIRVTGVDDEGTNITETNYIETYQISIDKVSYSTKNIIFTPRIVNGANQALNICGIVVEYGETTSYVNEFSGCSNGISKTINNLTHNTEYEISIWIGNNNGIDMVDENGILDTIEGIHVWTKKLTIENTGFTAHQHSIDSYWQAHAIDYNNNKNGDKEDYEQDNIDRYKTSFVLGKCISTPGTLEGSTENSIDYKTPDRDKYGTSTGNYAVDKTLYTTGLDYWSVYTITCTITDGHNEVSEQITAHTTFPYMYIYINSDKKWHKTIPYIYYNSKWRPSVPFIYKKGLLGRGEFKICNGE